MGQLLETFVYQELRRHASWHDGEIRFSHYRDKDGAEVDLVLERGGGQIAGVEVKAAATVTAAETAMCSPITDDRELQRSIREIITTVI